MRLPPFTLHRPPSLDAAIELLAEHGDDAAFYMGGTELLLVMKLGFAQPGHLVDGKAIAELSRLTVSDELLQIGAGVTHRRLERHGDVQRLLPTMAAMERRVANVRVRNVGTIGGNLCFAEPHSDPATLLTALDARLVLRGPAGERIVPIGGFFEGALSTALGAAELLTRIDVPVPTSGTRVGFQRIAFKERPDAAVALAVGPVAARVVIGALGPTPMRVPAAEERLLVGDVEAAAVAATDTVAAIDTAEGADYRAHLAGVLLRRAWRDAVVHGSFTSTKESNDDST